MAQDSELPLPNYDELPLNALKHEVRSLRDDQLRTLLEHEREHANRVPVIELLTTRLDQLAEGAEPSGGNQQAHSGKPEDTLFLFLRPRSTCAFVAAPARHARHPKAQYQEL